MVYLIGYLSDFRLMNISENSLQATICQKILTFGIFLAF